VVFLFMSLFPWYVICASLFRGTWMCPIDVG
jgi:hypothetical protein